MNTFDKLNKWLYSSKARSVMIEHDNGYGAACWVVELMGEKSVRAAQGTPLGYDMDENLVTIQSKEDGYKAFYYGKLLVVCDYEDTKNEASLEKVILAALSQVNG